MDHLIKTLPAVLRAGGQSQEVIEASAFAAWNHVAGEQLRKHAVPVSLSGKTLIVAVTDSIWQKQLEGIRAQLLFRLKSVLGQPVVSRIEFRVDPGSVAPASAPKHRTRSKMPADQRTPESEKDVSLELWAAASSIKDKQLRQALLAAADRNIRSREEQS